MANQSMLVAVGRRIGRACKLLALGTWGRHELGQLLHRGAGRCFSPFTIDSLKGSIRSTSRLPTQSSTLCDGTSSRGVVDRLQRKQNPMSRRRYARLFICWWRLRKRAQLSARNRHQSRYWEIESRVGQLWALPLRKAALGHDEASRGRTRTTAFEAKPGTSAACRRVPAFGALPLVAAAPSKVG